MNENITNIPEHGVNLNYRYVSAWNEVNTRIQKRQDAIIIYLTSIGALIGLITKYSGDISSTNVTDFSKMEVFVWFIPVFSCLFIFLNIKHELTIANLRAFLKECEDVSQTNWGTTVPLPGYHTTGSYLRRAMKTRLWHDIACMLLMLICNGIAFYILYKSHSDDILKWDKWVSLLFYAVSFLPPIALPILVSRIYKKKYSLF